MNIRNSACACLLLLLASMGASSWAAGSLLEAYSPAECSMWYLEDALLEDLARPQSALSASPKLHQVLTDNLQSAMAKGFDAQLLRGQAFPKKKGQEPKAEQISEIGCIRQQRLVGSGNDSGLQCHVEVGNRISTYVFQTLPKQRANELESYGCTGDCVGYPVLVVHQTPWEDGPASRRQKRASTEYAKRCL